MGAEPGGKDWKSVGTAERRPGRRSEGLFELAQAPDKPFRSPVIIVEGAKPGPTLWVQACVHGTEVGGIGGLHRFLDALDPAALSGTVVALMTANPAAYLAQTRNTPVDGENLNRVFPGNAGGGHSARIADRLLREALRVADVIVDLHSGGDRSHVPHYTLFWADGSAAAKEAGRLASAADVDCVWAATDAWLSGSLMAQATRAGVPAVIIECGGAGQVPDAHVEAFARSLRAIAVAAGLLPGKAAPRPARRIDRCTLVYNRTGGLFVSGVKAGDVVAAGAPIGEIRDLAGKVVETIRSPVGPAWLAALRKNWAAVPTGEMIAECVVVQEGNG